MNISDIILKWYSFNARHLPWRETKDPYMIWVSEIIMQQTRVEQGLPYYLKFTELFPTVYSLATASEEQILLAWQGLGYYSRARNMHFTAKTIVSDYNGIFPKTAKELQNLKGIGNYTAAAISSICNNENIAAVDGNVIRVISRLYNIQEPVNKASTLNSITEICNELIKNYDASKFNQALMDIGSSICTPKKYDCNNCPLNSKCQALSLNTIAIIPFKNSKVKTKTRYFNYIIYIAKQNTIIKKRITNDIWQGLYEFPLIELNKKASLQDILEHETFKIMSNNISAYNIKMHEVSPHKLSHQTIITNFIIMNVHALPNLAEHETINLLQLPNFAFPQLIQKYISRILNDKFE